MTNAYKIKSSATRAAKAKIGENWAETHTISQNEAGEWEISPKGQALTKFLADHEAELAAKKVKALELKAAHAKEIENTPEIQPATASEAPAAIPDIPAIPESLPPAIPSTEKGPLEGLAEAMIAADKAADALIANVDPLKPRVSTAEKPTKKVWHIADQMNEEAQKANRPAPTRKEVMEECVRQGVAYGTARTQYQAWFKCINDSKAAPIAVIGKDGKVTMPGKE